MTVLDTDPHRLRASVRAVRRVLPRAGCGLPAVLLTDPLVAAWVRAHGVSVHASDAHDLGLVRANGVASEQVMWGCGATAVGISGALACGVTRFVASAPRHLDVLAETAAGAVTVHLDPGSDGRHGIRFVPTIYSETLSFVGMHCCVESSAPRSWAAAAGRLLAQIADLRCPEVMRISLSGGTAVAWLHADKPALTAIASAVDDAIDEGCARWRLARPAVTLGPSCL